jgi:hypothetical protein
MTREELLAVLAVLRDASPATADTVAEACLLEFLAASGYADVVQAYLDAIHQSVEDLTTAP